MAKMQSNIGVGVRDDRCKIKYKFSGMHERARGGGRPRPLALPPPAVRRLFATAVVIPLYDVVHL